MSRFQSPPAVDFTAGNYRFVPNVFQYSGAVAAMPGHHIERVTFARPVPLKEGFARIASTLAQAGRPLTAFCACELRSPAPFDEAGFRAFNQAYAGTLGEWGLVDGDTNPVARANVCPAVDPPAEPSFHAFSFVATGDAGRPSFVVAGSGEGFDRGPGHFSERIVRFGEISADALRDKARTVLAHMEGRMAPLGFGWPDTTAAQVHTLHDIGPILETEFFARGAARNGLTLHHDRPPIVGLEILMDTRGVTIERFL